MWLEACLKDCSRCYQSYLQGLLSNCSALAIDCSYRISQRFFKRGCLRFVDCESGNCRSMRSLHVYYLVDLCSDLSSSSLTCFPQMINTWANFVPPLLGCSVKWCFRRCDCREVQWLLQEAGSLDRICLQAVRDLSLYGHWCLQSHRHRGLF